MNTTLTKIKLGKCDGCIGKAVTRVTVYPEYLELCNHHTNRLLERMPNAEILEDNRGDDAYKIY